MKRTLFGATSDGRPASLYALSNGTGLEVLLSDFGATIVSLRVADRRGSVEDVVLGHRSLAEYVHGRCFIGGTIGRYANRIALGQFTLNGETCRVSRNAPPHHLHGGFRGFHKCLWSAEPGSGEQEESVTFSYRSGDGEEGFPGNLAVSARFTVPAARNELRISFDAQSDRDTVVNLTAHPYFNLSGPSARDILEHQLLIRARRFTPVDSAMIPTGELWDVKDSPFDFTRLTTIGARIDDDRPQLLLAGGYDHNWVLESAAAMGDAPAVELLDPSSGRHLAIFTSEPGIQFYSGNALYGTIRNRAGGVCGPRSALCLEPQHFPDSPNHPHFPSVVLRRGQRFRSHTTYRFSVDTGSFHPAHARIQGRAPLGSSE